VREALADPQLEHRRSLAEVNDAGGMFKVVNAPFRMSRSETMAGPRAAALGEHTREVLASIGYDKAEIAAITGS
jgi:CoA:oxalate CoA-transferase